MDCPLPVLLAAIEAKRNTEDWTKAKGQFVPLPATWLRGKRWEDEGVTIAPRQTGPDPALAKLKADSALAVPPPAAIREQLAQVTGKLTEKTRATA